MNKEIQAALNVKFNEGESRIFSFIDCKIAAAESRLDIAVAWLNDPTLITTISRVALKGVQVRIVLVNDRVNNADRSKIQLLLKSQVELCLVDFIPNQKCGLMHHKFCIIDYKQSNCGLISGSYNWTKAARFSDENIIYSKTEELIGLYYNQFETVRSRGKIIKSIEEYDSCQSLEDSNLILLDDRQVSILNGHLTCDIGCYLADSVKEKPTFKPWITKGTVVAQNYRVQEVWPLTDYQKILHFQIAIRFENELYPQVVIDKTIPLHPKPIKDQKIEVYLGIWTTTLQFDCCWGSKNRPIRIGSYSLLSG